jgi:lipopolysaccharide transport system permease protein
MIGHVDRTLPSPEPTPTSQPARTFRLERTRGFSRVLSPAELWRYRDVAWQIAARDVKVRYRQAALGGLWAVLQPLATMVVFTIIFGRLAGISSGGVDYPLFSLAGLVPWSFFSSALLLGSDSLVANSALVSKIYFPRIFIPAGIVVAGVVDFGVAFAILVVVVLAAGTVPTAGVVLVPFFLLIAVAAALGITSALAALNVRYRDVRYVVPFAVQLWLLSTPVAYPSSLLDEPWRTLSALNPMAGVVEGIRWAMFGEPAFPLTTILISSLAALLVAVGGLAYFDRVERRFADVL